MNTPPIDPGPCLLCKRPTMGGPRPMLLTVFIAAAPDGRYLNVPVHVACFIETVAGRVADVVLDAVRTGEVRAGVDAEGDLGRVVGDLLGSVIGQYARVG